MKISYKRKIFLYAFFLLTLFAGSIVLFEFSESKRARVESIEGQLDVYATTLYRSIQKKGGFDKASIDSLLFLFPQNLRITILDSNGQVTYDNIQLDTAQMDNHIQRPEVIQATQSGKGRDIRTSMTNEEQYLYFAKQYQSFYIRVALPYNMQLKEILKTDNIFLYFIIVLFVIALYSIHILSKRLSQSIRELRDFTRHPSKLNEELVNSFPQDELGEVAYKVVENYRDLEHSKAQIALEREKLLQHIHSSQEGICFFTPTREVEFFNGLFMHYLNIMLDENTTRAGVILHDPQFKQLHDFLSENNEQNFFESKIAKQGRQFNIRVNIFEDKSFEIIINDISDQEKTRLLKQEMTNNIAHELRTPITSIRGYLETVKTQELTPEQHQYFLDKAYSQVINLTQLIDDMSMITSIEEVPQSFDFEEVNLNGILQQVYKDYQESLLDKGINFYSNLPENCLMKGNQNLLYAVFRNLVENTIKYGGENAHIHINLYNEDNFYYYLSYANEGSSVIDEIHLKRLFERFYRVSSGRTRKTGGTGLGLSIVKNAIQIHKGSIIAKNRKEGGLEFLFKLRKN